MVVLFGVFREVPVWEVSWAHIYSIHVWHTSNTGSWDTPKCHILGAHLEHTWYGPNMTPFGTLPRGPVTRPLRDPCWWCSVHAQSLGAYGYLMECICICTSMYQNRGPFRGPECTHFGAPKCHIPGIPRYRHQMHYSWHHIWGPPNTPFSVCSIYAPSLGPYGYLMECICICGSMYLNRGPGEGPKVVSKCHILGDSMICTGYDMIWDRIWWCSGGPWMVVIHIPTPYTYYSIV